MSRSVVKDTDAFERKVRPIYDALDSRNWKVALKLCQQALQKYPDNELVKVLKAIGLERSGKREEANEVVDEVAATTPIDDQVLRLAAMVMRGSGRLADITRMYEAAAAAAAGMRGQAELAQALLHDVFGAHVRECNFVKQQQVAMRLSKGAASGPPAGAAEVTAERYGWWVVLSLLLQARAALRARASGLAAPAGQVPAVALEPEKLLALAEGMVSRQASKDKRLEGYEALMVYVDVMLAQGKVVEALALVAGPLGESSIRLPAERLQLRAVLAALAGDLEAAAAALGEGLRLNPDDWGALLLLLDCMLPGTAVARPAADGRFTPAHPLILISGGLAEQLPPHGAALPADGGVSAEAFDRAEALIKELEALGREASSPGASPSSDPADGKAMIMRGPDLALVDLAMRRHRAASLNTRSSSSNNGNGSSTSNTNSSDLSDTEAAVVQAVLSYFRKYGSLVSCAVDVRTYVAQLGPAEAEALAEALAAEVAGDVVAAATWPGTAARSDKRAALTALRRKVCLAQVRDDLGLPHLAAPEQGVALARELLELHETAQPLQEGLDERERGAADELPVLAAAALATAAAAAPTAAAAVPYMLAAYGALADAVRHRPYGGAMRICAAALAALLAAPGASAAHLYKLDIKHIQLDTLGGHLLLPPLLAWPSGAAPPAAGPAAVAAGESAPLPAAAFSPAHPLLAKALRDSRALFEDHGRDAGETAFTAYTHGMYTKVLEFNAFRERLAASHTLALLRGEGAIADALLRGGGGSSSSSGSSSGGSSTGVGSSRSEVSLAPDAMRAAALAAAVGVKVEEIPTKDALRFNWDLSTRPTWLPPCAAGPSLQPLEWWRCRPQAAKGQGYGRCWWSAQSSAEGPSAEAERWREAQAAAAAHRWLLPHCIAGALGGSGPEVLGLPEAVERLKALLPDSASIPGEPAAAAAAAGAAAGGGSALAGAEELRRLDVSLYGAALAVQEGLAAVSASGAASDAAADAAADAACAALAAAVGAACGGAAAAAADVAAAAVDSAAWGGVLPGGDLALMSHLLREPMSVLAACVQSWQSSVKALRKKRAKAGQAALGGGAQRLADAVAAAAAGLAAAARTCSDALAAGEGSGSSGGGEVAAATAETVRYLQAQGHAPLGEGGLAALEALAREQRSTLAALARHAAAVAAAVA